MPLKEGKPIKRLLPSYLADMCLWHALFKHPGHAPLALNNPSAVYQLQMLHSIWQPHKAKQLLSATRQTALPCRAPTNLVQSFQSRAAEQHEACAVRARVGATSSMSFSELKDEVCKQCLITCLLSKSTAAASAAA